MSASQTAAVTFAESRRCSGICEGFLNKDIIFGNGLLLIQRRANDSFPATVVTLRFSWTSCSQSVLETAGGE
jgi:hypothetical protein